MPELTLYASSEEWIAEGKRRFGDFMNFAFVCPICGNIAKVSDFRPFKDRGATTNSATNECIGRYTLTKEQGRLRKPGERPCNYAGYGLFRLSPVRVTLEPGKDIHSFAFAEALEPANETANPNPGTPEVKNK